MGVLQNKKVRIGVGIAAVVLAAAALGAGTYAAFVDTETGPGGTVAAGTLDLTVGSTGTLELFAAQNIQPGFSQDATITLRNAGSLPGGVTSTLTVVGADVTCTEPEAEAEGVAAGACAPGGNLQNQMTVSVLRGPGITAPTTPVTVSQFALPPAGTLAAGASSDYVLQFVLPNLAGTVNNIVQGDRITVSSNFVLTQS
ncbi:TasA family protein [Pseudonocardia saturnea]